MATNRLMNRVFLSVARTVVGEGKEWLPTDMVFLSVARTVKPGERKEWQLTDL